MITKVFTLDGINRKADKSITLRITTLSEQTSEELKQLDMLFHQTIVVAIKSESTPFLDSEIEALDNVDMDLEDTGKTPSRRLMNVLFRLHEKELGRRPDKEEFKQFYKNRMERLIGQIKNKLD